MILLLDFSRLFLLDSDDLVIARGPVPPAAIGFPTPNRTCISFAFRVLGGGINEGCGVGGALASTSALLFSSLSSSSIS